MAFEVDVLARYERLVTKKKLRLHHHQADGPLIPCIVGPPKPLGRTIAGPHPATAAFAADVKARTMALCDEHNLNGPQQQCLLHAANWLLPAKHRFTIDAAVGPHIAHQTRAVELVHGAFGAGKSFTLSLVLQLLCGIVAAHRLSTRILLAAATNNAVDGVLRCVHAFLANIFLLVGGLVKVWE